MAFTATVTFILVVLVFVALWVNEDDAGYGFAKTFLFFFACAFLMLFGFELADKGENYKQGQVDAITGKVKYELKTLPDSTREWVEIKTK